MIKNNQKRRRLKRLEEKYQRRSEAGHLASQKARNKVRRVPYIPRVRSKYKIGFFKSLMKRAVRVYKAATK